MEANIVNEIKLLEENKNKIDSGPVIDLIIHSVKGKYICEEKRKNFVLSRTAPLEKIFDPSFVKTNAKEFLDCYADINKRTKGECQEQYKKVFECLTKDNKKLEKISQFPVKCVASMEDFILC